MEKGGIYWNAWKDLFNFHKSYTGIKQTDEFWEQVRTDAIRLEYKYKDTRAADFVSKVLVQILLELEREENNI